MTLSKKANWGNALTTSTARQATPRARRRISVDYRLLEEIGAWLLLAGVSLLGWIVTAIAIGAI